MKVDPAETVTVMLAAPAPVLVVDSRTLVASALVIVTGSPPAGAAKPSEPDVATSRSFPTVVLKIVMFGTALTVTAEVTSEIPVPLARRVVLPVATPVTGTRTDVAPARIVAVAGTVATNVLSVLRFNVSPPAGAGAEL